MRPIDFNGWVRVVIFSLFFLLAVAYLRQDVFDRMQFARFGREVVATVVEEAEMRPRPGGAQYDHRLEYEGRTAKCELPSPLAVGSHVAIEYVPRPRRDLVRVLPASWPWGSVMFLPLAIVSAMAVVQEFRGLSWWRPVLIVYWQRKTG